MRYKQKIIPVVDVGIWSGMTPFETRSLLFEEFRTVYQNKKTVVNKHLGIRIWFNRDGGKKLSFGGKIYPKKASVLSVLDEVLENAVYNNFGSPKTRDKYTVIGYLNFKAKILIDGISEYLHLVIQIRRDGYYYYSHEINKKRS